MKYLAESSDGDDTYLTLDHIRKVLPKSNWRHDRMLEEVDAAVSLGIMPSQFWEASRQDQAWLLAYFRTKRVMEAYENHLAKKKA